MSGGWMYAAVPATGLWSDPESARRALPRQLDSQVLLGEPVEVVEHGTGVDAGWVRVVCPEQPSSRDSRGYPGWVLAGHLSATPVLDEAVGPTESDFLTTASRYAGVPYLWGGLTAAGIDCSGLVHASTRALGIRVPRDAHDQHAVADPVELDQVQPGDLYFFARPGALIHHVGIVTGPGAMLHAPMSGAMVVDEPLNDERRLTLVAAGRLPGIR